MAQAAVPMVKPLRFPIMVTQTPLMPAVVNAHTQQCYPGGVNNVPNGQVDVEAAKARKRLEDLQWTVDHNPAVGHPNTRLGVRLRTQYAVHKARLEACMSKV